VIVAGSSQFLVCLKNTVMFEHYILFRSNSSKLINQVRPGSYYGAEFTESNGFEATCNWGDIRISSKHVFIYMARNKQSAHFICMYIYIIICNILYTSLIIALLRSVAPKIAGQILKSYSQGQKSTKSHPRFHGRQPAMPKSWNIDLLPSYPLVN
jgi:hypothetical protein